MTLRISRGDPLTKYRGTRLDRSPGPLPYALVAGGGLLIGGGVGFAIAAERGSAAELPTRRAAAVASLALGAASAGVGVYLLIRPARTHLAARVGPAGDGAAVWLTRWW